MSALLKKSVIIFLILLQFFAVLAKPLSVQAAAGPWYSQDLTQWYTKVYDDASPPSEIFGERYTAAQVQWVAYGFVSLFINLILGNNTELGICLLNPKIIHVGDCKNGIEDLIKGFAGLSANIDADTPQYANKWQEVLVFGKEVITTDRPMSAIGYTKNTLTKLKLIPEAKAQATGYGYDGLEPLREVWTAFRNISYAFFVIITIVMAFMIMFRVKLSPQTVVTIQSALPKIFVTLILVTFSYAIAGLLIDLMYVVVGILAIVFNQAGITDGNVVNAYRVLTRGPYGYGGIFLGAIVYSVAAPIGLVVSFASSGFWALLATLYILAPIALLIIVVGIIVMFIVAIFITIKIIWTLFKALAMVLLLTMFSPIIITLGAIVPGGSVGFGGWLKQMIANLAVFPLVGFMFILAFWFLNGAFGSLTFWNEGAPTGSIGFQPPGLFFGDGSLELIWLGVSFVIFVSIPKAANLVKSAMSGQPFDLKSAIGEAMGPGTYLPSQAYGTAKAGAEKWGADQVTKALRDKWNPAGAGTTPSTTAATGTVTGGPTAGP